MSITRDEHIPSRIRLPYEWAGSLPDPGGDALNLHMDLPAGAVVAVRPSTCAPGCGGAPLPAGGIVRLSLVRYTEPRRGEGASVLFDRTVKDPEPQALTAAAGAGPYVLRVEPADRATAHLARGGFNVSVSAGAASPAAPPSQTP